MPHSSATFANNTTPVSPSSPVGSSINAAWLNSIDGQAYLLSRNAYNVRESTYGALGDSSTNDTTAIQATVNAVGGLATGGTVYIPPSTGYYKLSATVTVPDNVSIVGGGFKPQVGEITGDYILGGGSRIRSDSSSITFKNSQAGTANLNRGIELIGLSIEGWNDGGPAVLLDGCWRSHVERCWISNRGSGVKQNLHVWDCEQIHVAWNMFQGGELKLQDTRVTTVLGCEGTGTDVGGSSCYVNGQCYGSAITNSHFYSQADTAGPGLLMDDVQEFTVMGSVFESCGEQGIYMRRGNRNCRIENNYAKNNGWNGTPGLYDGIVIDTFTGTTDTYGNIISGNTCMDTQGTKTQRYGIQVLSTQASRTYDNIITNNNLINNQTGPLNVGSDAVYDANRIADNHGVTATWPQTYYGALDPTTTGKAAAQGSLYCRKGVGVYKKTGSGNTAWAAL